MACMAKATILLLLSALICSVHADLDAKDLCSNVVFFVIVSAWGIGCTYSTNQDGACGSAAASPYVRRRLAGSFVTNELDLVEEANDSNKQTDGGNKSGNGRGGCRLSDIQTRQRLTGKVEGKATFQVSISNQCSCPQAEVVVRCVGLYDSAVDKTKIRLLNGDLCSVGNGEPIALRSPVNFTYTQTTPE